MIRKGDEVTLIGLAESNTNVSDLMRDIETSTWLRAPQLSEIKKQSDVGEILSEFNLQMVMINPEVEAEEAKRRALNKNTQSATTQSVTEEAKSVAKQPIP